MNRADALQAATSELCAGVAHLTSPNGPTDAEWDEALAIARKWAVIVLALRFASPSPIVVEVAR